MTQRTIVLTGASDGIGAAAARAFANLGDTVVVVGRSPEKTRRVAERLDADYFVADFAKLQDVRELAAKLRANYPRIDVLANNAGGIMGKRQLTVDGYEKTFQVNHLAPFLLTTLLLDVLTTSHATVINTSSAGNKFLGNLDIHDLQARKKYGTGRAYGNAKLANILFTKELHRRYNAEGISTAAFHPGVVSSNFAAGSTSPMRIAYTPLLRRFLITPERGADTLVWLANTRPGHDWVSGEYYDKRKIAKAHKQAYDAGLAKELWDRSEQMVQE
ncbi:MAG: short-chain dehydrogenase/reductase [Micrococcaceae bacterium]|nr:short-chain dehydrogenase/reductase [Micrococcaceae bacterium]